MHHKGLLHESMTPRPGPFRPMPPRFRPRGATPSAVSLRGSPRVGRMTNASNVILRDGPADGQVAHVADVGQPIGVEDVGGGSITYVDTGEVVERDGVELRVYAPRR